MRLQDAGSGITRDSVMFFREHRHELGEVTRVAVRFPAFADPYDPYTMAMRDEDGNEMLLSGCTAGYVGEGPRAAMQILAELGFDPVQAQQVFTHPELLLNKNSDTCPTVRFRAPAEQAQARPPDRTRPMPVRTCEREL